MRSEPKRVHNCPVCWRRLEVIRQVGCWTGRPYYVMPDHKERLTMSKCDGSGREAK